MKKTFIVIVLMMVGTLSFGQQKPHYSQYMINPFLLNPAVSGTEDYLDIRAGYRNQWVGFPGAPVTYYLSAHSPINKRHVVNNRTRHKKNGFHGVGGILANDVTGPTSRFTINAAYSYHVAFSKKLFASMGLMGGLQQYRIDASQLTTADPGDPAIMSLSKTSLADVHGGVWVYSDHFYVGASVTQVMKQRIYNSIENNFKQGTLSKHYFLTGGYKIPFYYDFAFIPSMIIKVVSPAPVSVDMNCKVRYKDLVWGGMSYRHKDAIALMAGVVVHKKFDISYSYDFTTSEIRKYSSGTHEVVVGYRLTKSKLDCPQHFW